MDTADKTTFFEDWTALTEDLDKLVKDADNPFFKSKYVPLNKILPMIKAKCKKHNFIFMQFPTTNGNRNFLRTEIRNKNGEGIIGEIELVSKDPNDPQKLGGSITYMRRYSLTCMFGLEEEDDDGNFSASKPTNPKLDNSKGLGVCSVCGSQAIQGQWGAYCPNYKKHEKGEIITEKSPYNKKLDEALNLPTISYEDELDATELNKIK